METLSFTQCAAILFESAPKLEEIMRALASWPIAGQREQGPGEYEWAICGPRLAIDLRGEGWAIVDVVDRPWPDDAEAAEKAPALAAAWRTGAFGPFTTPGALARAIDQGWQGADLTRHAGFVRIRTALAAGKDKEPARPGRPIYDLMTVTELATALLRLEGALAFFVPGGEALRTREQLEAVGRRKAGVGPTPIELWTNVRGIALPPEDGSNWLLLDVVGMNQLGLPDQEAIFADGKEDPDAVEAMLRNACQHLLSGPIAPDSTSDDGRGRRWRASAARGIVAPPRPVLRWLPEESPRPAEATLAKLAEPSSATA
ncbi:MAG TPA: DUF4261 domain-containing protein [Myxococcales bacterium]|nr:DUF4261 domain-containing protein [Myxococcales bacterium]